LYFVLGALYFVVWLRALDTSEGSLIPRQSTKNKAPSTKKKNPALNNAGLQFRLKFFRFVF